MLYLPVSRFKSSTLHDVCVAALRPGETSWRASHARFTQEVTSLSRQWETWMRHEAGKTDRKKKKEKESGKEVDCIMVHLQGYVRWQESFSLFRSLSRHFLPRVAPLSLFRSDNSVTCSLLLLMKSRGRCFFFYSGNTRILQGSFKGPFNHQDHGLSRQQHHTRNWSHRSNIPR